MKKRILVFVFTCVVLIIFSHSHLYKYNFTSPKSFFSFKVDTEDSSILGSKAKVEFIQEADADFETLGEDSSSFYYDQLTSGQKEIYEQLLNKCRLRESKLQFKKAVADTDIQISMSALQYDHPEYFWLETYRTDAVNGTVRNLKFIVPKDIDEVSKRINIVVKEIIDGIPKNATEYERFKYLYEWICNNLTYSENENDQNIRSAFLDHKTVCAGYAKALKYLCKKAGIYCLYVTGYGDESQILHAWNMVRIDGKMYWSDPTWGDCDDSVQSINTAYFLASDNNLVEQKHEVLTGNIYAEGERLLFNYPKCNTMIIQVQ